MQHSVSDSVYLHRQWWGPLLLVLMTSLTIYGQLSAWRVAHASGSYIVNSTGDEEDFDLFDGECAIDTVVPATCTLRAAIMQANAADYTQFPLSIHFNIPGSGVHTIQPSTPLPAINTDGPVIIDGTTQPGASCATWPPTLLIELNGATAGGNALDFTPFYADGSTVRGLVINRFNIGIHMAYGSNNVIECNFIGTDVTGTTALPNTISGVYMQQESNNNRIGGPNPNQRNLIAGNPTQITMSSFSEGVTLVNNTIENNYIGTDVTGMVALGGEDGIYVFAGDGTQIRNNLVAGNNNGILIAGDSTRVASNNVIKGNYIGVNADATAALGNQSYGIWLFTGDGNLSATHDTTIGGGEVGEGNIIAGNLDNGIDIAATNTNINGNWIGTNASGANLGNHGAGIHIWDGSNTNIGGGQINAPNVIAYNNGPGVRIENGGGHALRRNSIFANGGIGIDLGTDGVTFNHQGIVAGPNTYLNYPVLTLATTLGSSVRVQGFLESTPDTAFIIDVYSNPTCDASAFGEGQYYLDSFQTTTNAAGKATFDQVTSGIVSEPYGITVTATDPGGNTSEFSYCRPVATPNLNWSTASAIAEGAATQYITDRYQEKWFKFPVTPGATVRIELTSPAGSAVSLHRDPNLFYNQLTVPTSAAALSAQAADTGFLPFQSLPFQSLPFQSLPFQSLPFQSLPTGFLPFQSLPFQSLPFQSLPFQSLPFQSLPFQSLPTGSLPFQSLPFQSLPFQSLPSDSLPAGITAEAYSGAARRSMLSIALDPSATVQTIDFNTYDLLEDLYVRVVGPNDLTTPFALQVNVEGGVCEQIEAVPSNLAVINGPAPSAGSLKTLILTDSGRLAGTTAEIAAALAKLQELANRTSDVAGVVIDLADARYQRVAWANTQADQNLACPTAKNLVAAEIKKVIDLYRAANQSTLQYIVLAGSAHVIPFFQVQDVAGLANEKEYVPPVKASTASEAGLKVGLVQGQDGYGAESTLNFGNRTYAVPDLAVGRLVETANDIVNTVNAYLAVNGVVSPDSALVTGYDFVGDAARAIKVEADAGTNATAETLIQDPGLPPSDPTAWSADALRAKLFAGGHDLVVLTGHFSAGDLLAADYRTSMRASEITASSVDFTNVIVFTLGCHGGYTIPSNDLLADASPDPDWAKAFLRKGVAGYVAATGYAYGDTELTEYGERLFVELSRQLRTGTGAIPLGKALVAAKQRYLAQTAQITGIDEKTLVQMSLYGLPMLKVDLPGQRLNVPADNSVVDAPALVNTAPGEDLGLHMTAAPVSPNLTPENVPLKNLADNSTINTTYLTSKDGVVVHPYEPLLPKAIYNVSADGLVLRGVALRSATYSDQPGVTPLTSAPATETSQAHPAFKTDKFYPNQVWASNFLSAISGGPERLVTVPAQFKSTTPDATDGILRSFTNLNFNFYYLPSDWAANPQSLTYKAAVATAPSILNVKTSVDAGTVTFLVEVQGEATAGMQAVWLLYTADNGPLYGQWQPLDLTQPDPVLNPTEWRGTLALPAGASAETLQFMVQAVNGAGATSLATNQGAYYRAVPATSPSFATTLTFATAPTSGAYLRDVTFRLHLTTDGEPLPGELVILTLGGQSMQAMTDENGDATVTLSPILLPGDYAVQATFRGNDYYVRSIATSQFTIVKEATTLTLTQQPGTVSALLRDAAERPLGLRSIVFVVSGNSQLLVRAVNADYWGNAALGAVALPPGTYNVTAYFNGVIDLGNGQTVTLTDDYYEAAQATGTLTIQAGDTTAPVVTVTFPTPPAAQNGWFNAQDALNGIVGTVTADDTTTGGRDITVVTCSGASVGTLTGQNTPQANASLTVTSEGSNAINCTATDSAGNSGAAVGSTNTATVQIDKSAPDTTIGDKPTNPTTSTSATFSFTGSDSGGSGLASFACQLDSSAFAPCTSPQSYSNLAVGSHTFTVRALDVAGNTDATPAVYTWTIQSNPNTLIGSCGGYDVYRTPQGQYVAAGWSGTIRVGTNSNNALNGTADNDLMLGLGGNDALNGAAGDDVLCGGDGVDLIQGGAGNDWLDGGVGADVLNGGAGDYDQLVGGDGNDTLLDADGVLLIAGGPGNDLLTLALRRNWRNQSGQARFTGLSAGYGNDTVGLAILDTAQFFVDITGDERDASPSPLEGQKDKLALAAKLDPTSVIIKFEQRVITATAAAEGFAINDDTGTEYLTETVGEETVSDSQNNYLFLPFIVN